jgi:hypothetical protein
MECGLAWQPAVWPILCKTDTSCGVTQCVDRKYAYRNVASPYSRHRAYKGTNFSHTWTCCQLANDLHALSMGHLLCPPTVIASTCLPGLRKVTLVMPLAALRSSAELHRESRKFHNHGYSLCTHTHSSGHKLHHVRNAQCSTHIPHKHIPSLCQQHFSKAR